MQSHKCLLTYSFQGLKKDIERLSYVELKACKKDQEARYTDIAAKQYDTMEQISYLEDLLEVYKKYELNI